MKRILAPIYLLSFISTALFSQESSFPELSGPYLGQEPPGNTPIYFAPGIITVEENFEHSAAIFSPDGKEVFWCTNVDWYTDKKVPGNLRLYTMEEVDGRWTAPHLAHFAKDIRVERPVFSNDGMRLYFESYSTNGNEDNADVFMVERQGDGWSDPKPISSLINTSAIERLYCVTADGSLYFSRDPFTSREEIFVSRIVNGEFAEPEKLDESYNSEAFETALIVEPDEQYMLVWQNLKHKRSFLTVSYKLSDGSWSERIEVPFYCGNGIALSPDKRYLFLENEGIAWVSTSFIDELKPDDLK